MSACVAMVTQKRLISFLLSRIPNNRESGRKLLEKLVIGGLG